MEQQIIQLKKQVSLLKHYFFFSTCLLLVFIFSAFNQQEKKFGIIRAKGLIIEDSAGRDRVLLGAPIPFSKNRIRTDTARVRKYWAKNFGSGDQYMKWYNNYNHGTVGMVVMNEEGFDRVLTGDKIADPNIGKRAFEAAGIVWNNKDGWERGGAVASTTEEGNCRSVIGVDNKQGEAVHLLALEDGTNAVSVSGEQGTLLIGFSQKDGSYFENKEAFTGMKFFNKKGALVWEQKVSK